MKKLEDGLAGARRRMLTNQRTHINESENSCSHLTCSSKYSLRQEMSLALKDNSPKLNSILNSATARTPQLGKYSPNVR